MSGPPRIAVGLSREEAQGLVDEAMRARALELLCRPLGMGRLWTAEGPTAAAEELRDSKRCDPRARLLIQAAWSIWDQSADPGLVELSRGLRAEDAARLFSLLAAIAGGDVRTWIDANQDVPRHA